jgi:hypothetical protein
MPVYHAAERSLETVTVTVTVTVNVTVTVIVTHACMTKITKIFIKNSKTVARNRRYYDTESKPESIYPHDKHYYSFYLKKHKMSLENVDTMIQK